ncbi:MAG: lipid II flippase MurJ [Geodermatophilaceae bacterium]
MPPPRPLRSWQVEAPETLPGESLTTYVPAPADEREPVSSGGSRLLRATGTMAVATAVSRITGGLKAAVLSAAIGIGLVGDAYTTANYLPNIVYELLIGGVLTSVVVPLLVRAQESDEDGGIAYAQRLFSLITTLVVGATALAIVAAPLLTYAYGIRGDSSSGRTRDHARPNPVAGDHLLRRRSRGHVDPQHPQRLRRPGVGAGAEQRHRDRRRVPVHRDPGNRSADPGHDQHRGGLSARGGHHAGHRRAGHGA